MAGRIFTDLDLHEDVPLRARPRIGEWGAPRVPTTTGKRAFRVLVPILFLVVLSAVLTLGYFVFRTITEAVGL